MLAEHDLAALRADLPEHRLQTGDTDTIVAVYSASHTYTIEFMTWGGDTVALLTLPETQIRAVVLDETALARPLASAA